MIGGIVGEVLKELMAFAMRQGPQMVALVNDFARQLQQKRPDLCEANEPCAPPERSDAAIDAKVEEAIKRGDV